MAAPAGTKKSTKTTIATMQLAGTQTIRLVHLFKTIVLSSTRKKDTPAMVTKIKMLTVTMDMTIKTKKIMKTKTKFSTPALAKQHALLADTQKALLYILQNTRPRQKLFPQSQPEDRLLLRIA